MRSISSTPAAHSSGPTVSGIRGPIRLPRRPARADSASISTVIGTSAKPETSGENPETICSCTTSRKKTPLNAAYTHRVTRFTAVNSREENSPRGSIGSAARCSTATKAAPSATPIAPVTQTVGDTPSPAAVSA